ncbi:MAG: hypothetical protein QM661_07060 [Solimonas sp.]
MTSIGSPPAYFYAVSRNGSLLLISGSASVNVPTSIYAGRVLGANQQEIQYVDLAAVGADYQGYGVVAPGLRLPADQQPPCDENGPDAECEPRP